MLPDRVSNPGPLTYESGALPIALRGPAAKREGSSVMHQLRLKTIQHKTFLASRLLFYYQKADNKILSVNFKT